LLFRQQSSGARTPEELLELVNDVLLELHPSEVPDCIAILNLDTKIVHDQLRYGGRD
jgi:hypothetical protein